MSKIVGGNKLCSIRLPVKEVRGLGLADLKGKEDDLDSFLPEPPLSPIQLLKLKGKVRRKASKSTAMKKVDEKDLGW